jgi:hypothetical protein
MRHDDSEQGASHTFCALGAIMAWVLAFVRTAEKAETMSTWLSGLVPSQVTTTRLCLRGYTACYFFCKSTQHVMVSIVNCTITESLRCSETSLVAAWGFACVHIVPSGADALIA